MHLVSEAETLMGKRLVMDAVSVVIERVGQKVEVVSHLVFGPMLMNRSSDSAVPTHLGRSNSGPM